MKKSILSVIFLLMCLSVLAQSPQAINYQAVVRDVNGMVLPNQNVSFQLSVLETSASGTAVYIETHNVTTNDFGLANLQIGAGTVVSGTFNTIDWGGDSHFLQVELDETGGSNYTLMGAAQFVSVPYALHANTVENDLVDDADADSTNELNLSAVLNGTDLEITDAGGTLTTDLSSLQDGVIDADADPTNEIQTLSRSAGMITLSNGGGMVADSVNDADASPTNELNSSLSLNADTLELTDAGGTLSVPLGSLIDDGDWTRNGDYLYNLNDTVGIGPGTNTNYNARFQVGSWLNNPLWMMDDSLSNTVWIGGGVNTPDQRDIVKLMIGGYDNDGSTVYPLVARDENGNTDFYLKNRPSALGDPFAYFDGGIGIGTETPYGELAVDGSIRIVNGSNNQKVRIYEAGGSGEFRMYGANGNLNCSIGNNGSDENEGIIFVADDNGAQSWGAADDNGGEQWTYGINGNLNSWSRSHSSSDNHGYFSVNDAGGTSEAGLYVNASSQGVIFGDIKNFRMDHPTKPGKEIWYASLEGPEAGAYARGTGRLVNGAAFVEFDEHFQLVANHTTMTVSLTPLDGGSKGLAVIEKSENGFRVVELMSGSGNYEFDWEVKAVRAGYEDYRVERDASEMDTGLPPQLHEQEEEEKPFVPSSDADDPK